MKLSVILLLVSMHLAIADVGAQAKITIEAKTVTYLEVFNQIKEQTGFTVVYSNNELNKHKTVEAGFLKLDLKVVLDKILAGTGLTYEIMDEFIVLKVAPDEKKQKTLFIVGSVTDQDKAPLPGVTVAVKGLKVGTATDQHGRYRLNIPEIKDLTLLFSFVGMKTQEVKYTGKNVINVVMEEDTKTVDEVVVTGYQTINRRDMVGSYTSMKVDDILMPAYNSIDQMLQGRVAGLMVVNTSSRVGTSPKIKLRGTSTILGNQAPLWVVDGVIQEDPLEINVSGLMTQDLKDIIGSQISWLNPMDIETVTILKDASATAIYGSKASNGVIVVTTKKGQSGQLTVNYVGNMTINTRPNYGMFNYMNSKERIQFSDDAYDIGLAYKSAPIADAYTYEGAMQMYYNGDMTSEVFAQRKTFLETVNTDWFDLLTRSAVSHNHNLSLRGGGEAITYNVSLGYSNALGQEIGNDSERMTGRLSINARLHEKVRLNAALNLSSTETNSFGPGVSPINYATTTSRAIPAYDEDGTPVYYQRAINYPYNKVSSLSYNFINERDNSNSQTENLYISGMMNFKWNILEWLTYEFVGGYSVSATNSESYATEKTYHVAANYRGYDYGTVSSSDEEYNAALLPFGGVLFTSNGTVTSYNVQNKFTFSKEFDSDHRLNAMLAMEIRSSKKKSDANTLYGYLPDRGEVLAPPTTPSDFTSLTSAALPDWGVYKSSDWKRVNQTDNYLSFFGTIAYSLKNRYVFNFSIRNDASNRFGQDTHNHFDPTYSFGLSWRATDEAWLQPIQKWMNTLNLRVTYGIQGNVVTSVGPDLLLARGGISADYHQFTSRISRLPNPDLSWESTKSWDFGLDVGLFKIFDLMFDYYWRKSDAIVTQDLAPEHGMSTMQINGGKLTNQGVEFTLSFTPVRKKNWALSISLNSSKNWNDAGETDYVATKGDFLTGSGSRILKKGYPLGGFWSYSFAGLSAEDGRPLFNYIDVPEKERNSKYDPTAFLVYSGTTEPDFTGGMNLSLRWKNLTLASNFSLLLGSKKRLPSPFEGLDYGRRMPDATVNLSKDLLKRWQKTGDERHTNIPGLVKAGESGTIRLPTDESEYWITMWNYSDARVVDASFFRCNQLSLTWRMNENWCKRMGLKSLSVNGSVSNLFVIASKRFNGFDPELGNSVQPKNFSLGINVGF